MSRNKRLVIPFKNYQSYVYKNVSALAELGKVILGGFCQGVGTQLCFIDINRSGMVRANNRIGLTYQRLEASCICSRELGYGRLTNGTRSRGVHPMGMEVYIRRLCNTCFKFLKYTFLIRKPNNR
jgi:hypothetical protein